MLITHIYTCESPWGSDPALQASESWMTASRRTPTPTPTRGPRTRLQCSYSNTTTIIETGDPTTTIVTLSTTTTPITMSTRVWIVVRSRDAFTTAVTYTMTVPTVGQYAATRERGLALHIWQGVSSQERMTSSWIARKIYSAFVQCQISVESARAFHELLKPP